MGLNHSPRIVTDGLVLCLDAANRKSYPGSGTIWTDLSGNGRNGTIANSPSFSNNSLVFDGTDDQVYTTGNSFTVQGPGNISGWIKPTNITSKSVVSIFNLVNAGTGSGIQIVYKATGTSFAVTAYGGLNLLQITNSENFPKLNENTFVSLNFSGSTIEYYKNGTLRQSTTNAANQTGTAPFIISGYTIANYTEAFTGAIYSASIYNRALTQSEILQNFNATRGRFGI